MRALSRYKIPRESQIHAGVTRSFVRVAAHRPGPIGVWIAARANASGESNVGPQFAEDRERETMRDVLARRTNLALDVEV